MQEEKRHLEKKLSFLKESLSAGVVSEEEYKKREELINDQLKIIEEKPKKEKQEKEPPQKREETKEEIKIEEIKQEKLKEMEEKESEEEQEKEGEKENQEEIKDEDIEDLQDKKKPDKKKNKKIIISGIVVLVILVGIYFYAFREANREAFEPECISDAGCQMEYKIGICLNPNTTEAKCEFKDDRNVSLLVINDKDCAVCDTARMSQIIKKLFPLVKKTEIDYNSDEGRGLAEKYDVAALPSYIFGPEIEETFNFNNFKRALLKKEDGFLVKPSASGSDYYFRRTPVKNKLDLFVLPSTPSAVESNVQEFLEVFGNKVDYSRKVVSSKEESNLEEELGITTYPAFLINNQFKFAGIHSPESIKTKFCEFNEMPECGNKLSEEIK